MTEREKALEEAAWAAHCWIVQSVFNGKFKKMPVADISVEIGNAIRGGAPDQLSMKSIGSSPD